MQLSNADPLPAQQAPLRAREAAARAGARDVAHWCEALSHAQPSPFLPLHVPRQRAGPARVDTQGPGSPTSAASRPPRSFFRRPLSAITVAYSSEKGRAMLGEVIGKRAGGAVFLDIMTAFEMQRHPVSCGMASLTIALNALKLAPWRGDEGLGGCSGAAVAVEETRAEREAEEEEFEMVTEDELSKVLLKETEKKGLEREGVSLQTLAEVALRINGMCVERLHAEGGTGGGFSEAEFRKAIIAATSGDAMGTSGVRKVMLLNFGRPSLGQTGSGHFSPIAAWHPASDMALVLDTARFKYPAFWAPVDTVIF